MKSDLRDIAEILQNNGYGGWCKSIREAISVIEKQTQEIAQFRQEQEEVPPVIHGDGKTFEEARTWWYACAVCGKPVDLVDHFCRGCGRAIGWNKAGKAGDPG